MIDVFKEELFDLKDAAKFKPFLNKNGKPPHIAAMYRYAQRGARAVNGERIKLDVVKTPAGMRTSREAVARWLQALTIGENVSTIDDATDFERAERALDAAGI